MKKKINKNNEKKRSFGEPSNFSGQHLLHNKRLLNEIVNKSKLTKRDLVLELGAGKGALTKILSEKSRQVLAVEYDKKFVDKLEAIASVLDNIKVIHQDILKISLPREPFVIVSNIPFAITTDIMKMLLNNPNNGLQRAIIIMEKGAAKRFTSNRVKDPYVMAWRMWFDLSIERGISREHFSPPPKVDSAMVSIVRKKNPLVSYKNVKALHLLLDFGLKYPNAHIDGLFRAIFTAPQAKKARLAINGTPDKVINSLSTEQWAILTETMVRYVPRHLWPKKGNR